jgi:hypothetical protein
MPCNAFGLMNNRQLFQVAFNEALLNNITWLLFTRVFIFNQPV